jgi:hypothetical protein
MTEAERQNLQERWKRVLLIAGVPGENESYARLRAIFEKAYDAVCDRNQPVTLVAVAASPFTGTISPPSDPSRPTVWLLPNDVLILRHDPMTSPVGPGMFLNIIGGTTRGPIGLPIHVFLFDDKGRTVQGEIDADGNWVPLPF